MKALGVTSLELTGVDILCGGTVRKTGVRAGSACPGHPFDAVS
jgi:hypothetical protein